MKHKVVLSVIALLVVLALLAGCGGTKATPVPETKLKVAMMLPGDLNDAGYNASAYAGLQAIQKDLGAETAYSEQLLARQSDLVEVYRDYASQGYTLIFGHGYEFGDGAMQVQAEFPGTFFVVSNGAVTATNVASTDFAWEQNSFVLGALAALMSKTGHIGIVGGLEIPPVLRTIDGYTAGAKYINPDIEVSVAKTGSFDDVARAQEAALAQIDSGVDVIMHGADKSGLGVIQAAQDKGIWAIGFIADQHDVAPSTIISSQIMSYPGLYPEIARMFQNGELKGQMYLFDMSTPSTVNIAPLTNVPDDVAKKVNDLADQIRNDKLDVTQYIKK
jgi:basic membrane protein A and related proteins